MNIKLINKLHKKTEVANGHWLWRGAKITNYGVIAIYNKNYYVHRLILSQLFRLNYKDYNWLACHIDSLCSYRDCWNPLHLYVGTREDNMQDKIKAGNNWQINKTHCPNGHEYTLENTYSRSNKKRSNWRE